MKNKSKLEQLDHPSLLCVEQCDIEALDPEEFEEKPSYVVEALQNIINRNPNMSEYAIRDIQMLINELS